VKKEDNIVNFATSRIINSRTQHNSFCTDKKKHQVTSYVVVYKAMSHVTQIACVSSPPLLH
jgi:hypothetical protein